MRRTSKTPSAFTPLSDEQIMFLLRAAYSPTLSFRPRTTRMLGELIDLGLLSERAGSSLDFPTLHLTPKGRTVATALLLQDETKRLTQADRLERRRRRSDSQDASARAGLHRRYEAFARPMIAGGGKQQP